MKKFVFLLIIAFVATSVSYAQSAKELAKEQRELNEIHMKLLKDIKPNKEAKKQAKQYKKEGWLVPAGEKSIEQQIMKSYLYGEELMADESGLPTKRFYQHTAISTSGSFNGGFLNARATAQNELAAMIKTELVSILKMKIDNQQTTSITANTVEQVNNRMKSIVDEALTGSFPVMAIYRRLENGNMEVQVRIAFDKRELAARLKRNMQRELENEGDELEPMVDELIRKKF